MSEPKLICLESSPEWHAERSKGIGGSDAPALLGLSKWGGPASVAAAKLGYSASDDAESELLKWGHYIEAPLIRAFADETGLDASLSGAMFRSGSPATPWMQATIDGVVKERSQVGGLQCKLAMFSAREWEEDGVPLQVWAQVQHEMAVMDWEFCYVLVLLGGYKPRHSRVERDEAFIRERLIPTEAAFWTALQAGEPIAPEGAPDAEYAALKARFPTPVPGKEIELRGDEWLRAFEMWERCGATAREAVKAQKEARNRLIAAIGDAEFAVLDGGIRLSLREQVRREFVSPEFRFRVLRRVGK